jgi:hypothetical protein
MLFGSINGIYAFSDIVFVKSWCVYDVNIVHRPQGDNVHKSRR